MLQKVNKMKALLLSSSPVEKNVQKEFLSLLDKKPEDIKVVMIPTAGYPKIEQKYVDLDISILKKLGVKNIIQIDLKEENEESLREKFSDVDVAWMGGGNTFWLMHWIRKSGFDKVLPELFKNGLVYVGTSAGSLVCGKDISISGWRSGWDRNVSGLKDFSGMGLVDYAISPHYVDRDQKAINSCTKETGIKIKPLRDGEFVVVNR